MHLIKNSKNAYYKKILTDNVTNLRQLWSIFKNLLRSNSRPSHTTLVIDDKIIDDPKEIANLFNTYFASTAENLGSSTPSSQLNFHSIQENADEAKFSVPPMTLDDVHDHFDNLTLIKQLALMVLLHMFLKFLNLLLPQLYYLILCNLSIKTARKKAKLIPLYKSDSQLDRGNYRPISILAVISKILEQHASILYSYYLTANNILSGCQQGFKLFDDRI